MAKRRREPSRTKSSRKSEKAAGPGSGMVDFWENIPLPYRHLIVLVFLLIVPSFIFSEVYFGGKRFVAHDIQQFQAAAQSVIDYQEETGEDALWAANIFSGMPSYTVISNKAFTHLDMILRRLFSARFIPVFPFIFCITGVCFFFWLMGYRPLPSALAALGICLTTYIPIIVGAGHNAKLIAYSWIPWVMAGYWMLSRSEKRLAGLFLFAIALNFTLRAEHIQVLYYFLFVLAIWFLYDTVDAFRNKTRQHWSRRAALMIVAGLLALAANIQPYWSIYEYSAYSTRGGSELQHDNRGSGGLDVDYAFAWSQGRTELLTLIIPGSFGGSSAEPVYWQRNPIASKYWGPKTFTSGPHYLGAIIFLMFLIGLIRAPGKLKYIFLGSGMLTLLFSLGGNFYSFNYLFFQYMPLFNKFRTPEMWLIVTVFCFSVIAAMGMKWICESYRDGTLSLRSLYLPGGMALVIALFFTIFIGSLLSFEKKGEREQFAQHVAAQQNMRTDDPRVSQFVNQVFQQSIIPQREETALTDSRRFLVFILLGSVLLGVAAVRIIPANYVLAGLVLLAAIDLVQVGNRYVDKSGLIPSDLPAQVTVVRQVRPIDRYIGQNKQVRQVWPWRSFPLGDSPFNNAVPAAFAYPSIGGYSGAKLSHYQDVIDKAIFGGQAGLNMPVLNMLNTRFLTYTGPLNLPGWDTVYESEEGVVMENLNVLPKAWFVDSLIVAANPREAMEELNRFDPASTAILMDNARIPEIVVTPNRSVEVSTYGPREIELSVSTDSPSFLVLSEIYYPKGWRATLNNDPVDIYRTNYILRGFEIPAGESQLTLRFDPRSHILGGRISWIFNLIILIIGVVAFYSHFRKE